MGCDIHVFSEYRELRYNYNNNREVIIGDKWISADFYQKIFNKETEEFEYILKHLYTNRDYNLFGRLAGVRNRNIEPISLPRGIPEDSCDLIKKAAKDFEYYHTPSYFTLQELTDASKNFFIEEWGEIINPLEELLIRVEIRAEDIFYSLNKEKRENFRIVFWFDS